MTDKTYKQTDKKQQNKRGRNTLLFALFSVTLLGLFLIETSAPPIKQSFTSQLQSVMAKQLTQAKKQDKTAEQHQAIQTAWAQLPLYFEAHDIPAEKGKAKTTRYLARGLGYSLGIEADAIYLMPQSQNSEQAIHMQFVDTQVKAPFGLDPLPGKVHYLKGKHPKHWQTNISLYASVQQNQLYPGIDIRYYGKQGKLEYDLIVAPNANIAQVQLAFDGIDSLKLDEQGNLLLKTAQGIVRQQKPHIYQEIDGKRQIIQGDYQMLADNRIGFNIQPYDVHYALVIDPVLDFSTYLGGEGTEQGLSIAVDESGNTYIAGVSASTNFPTQKSYQQGLAGDSDAFVAKLNPAGDSLIYATYFGGSHYDSGKDIAIDSNGHAYITGVTRSDTDFPIENALQADYGGGYNDAFISKLSPDGSQLIFSSYLGGGNRDHGKGIALDLDEQAAIYLTGITRSADFPVENAVQSTIGGGFDAYIAKLSIDGSQLHYASYIGGTGHELTTAIAVDSRGYPAITGSTSSKKGFPLENAVQAKLGGRTDAFITQLTDDGSAINYSSYLGGGNKETANGIAFDSQNNAVIVGEITRSRRRSRGHSFPLVNALQTEPHGRTDGFISKLSADGNELIFSTFLGGDSSDSINNIAIDNNDDLYLVGTTQSATEMPIVDAIQAELNAENGNKPDVYIAKLSSDGSDIIYATYLGGTQSDSGIDIAVNRQDAYITGNTQSNHGFPLNNPAQQIFGGGTQDAFIVKIGASNRALEIISTPVTLAGIGQSYRYAVEAQDEDGDSLSYQLITVPTGMEIDANGIISWVPDNVGKFEVQLQVSDGEENATQTWIIDVVSNRPNQPPTITSTPIIDASIDSEYTYPVIATDPDGNALSYQLLQAPLGLHINSTTGVINWTPTDAGDYPVQVRVDDGLAQVEQSWNIHINYGTGINPPTLTPIDNLTAPIGSTFKLQLKGNDIDGGTLVYGSDPMPLPKGMTLNAETGEFLFTPAPDQVGEHSITFSVSDGRFIAKQSLIITVPALSANTRLVGRVITTDAQPLANVRLETEGIETFSDANGDFSFNNLSESGQVRLLVDGSTVSPILGTFATVPEIIKVIAGANNKVEPAIVLLPLDVASADPVRPFKTSIITSSRFKNIDGSTSEPVTLTIPAGRAVKEDGTPFVGDIHISRIEDPTQGPRPLPDDIGLSVYIAMQPFGVIYPNPVPISFPNVEGFPPESIMDVFALDHATGRFEKIGEAWVSADGKTIDSDGGIVKSNSWHGITPQAPVTKKGKSDEHDKKKDECKSDACTFNIESGNLGESHNLPSYFSLGQARSVRLNYNSMSANPRPILNASSTIGNFSPPPTSMSSRLSVGGIEQGDERFGGVITEPATTRGSFKSGWVGVQFDAELFETGIYNYDWIVDCHFPISRRSETLNGQVIVQNEINSALGAGWTISGLRQLHINAEGLALMTEGNGIAVTFTPTNTDTYDSPPADFSTLTRNADNSFTRRMKDGTLYHFDQRGFQSEMVDRNGNTTQYRYDAEDRLQRITDPLGKTFIFNYSSSGYLSSITDAANRTTHFQHDSEGNLTKIIEPTGDQRSFEYQSGNHLLIAQTDQRNNRKEYGYDFAGRISSALLPDGSTVELRPSSTEGLIDPESGLGTSKNNLAPKPPLTEDIHNTYTDQNGNISRTETDERSAPTKKSDAVGRVTLIQRDGDSNPTQTTRPNLSVINRVYDSQGNITTSTEQFNGAINRYSYDDFSLITSVTNPNNHTTTINRNAITSNVESVVNHLGHTSQMRYYPNGLIKQSTSPNGLVTDYLYNTQQLPETITQTPPAESPGNTRITRYAYYPTGLLKQVITPDGITLNSVYDEKGRRLTVTDNLGQSVEYFYDSYNNLIKTDTQNADSSLALQAEQFYDSRNRLFEIKAPHNETEDSVTSWELDNNSNLKVLTDANGNSASNLYDREDRLLENSHRLEGITAYQYDTENRITQVTAPNGVITQYTYDVLGRKLTENSPDRGLLSYSYDLANNITRITEGRGIEVSYSYDELERIKTATYPNTIAGKDETVTYRYDNCDFGIGRLCQIEDESGITDYDYDAYGNIISKTHTELGINYTTRYQYDDGDRLSQITYPSGKIITIARDVLRRTQAINATLNGKAKTLVSNIQYRADNQMTQCTFGNGLIDNRAYDLQGRLTQQSLKTAQNSVIDQRSYGYDKNGNILAIDTNVEDDSFQYDALDRLIQQAQDASSPVGYDYDLNDNRIARNAVDLSLQGFFNYKPESNQLLRQETLFDSTQPVPPAIANRELVYNDAGRLYQLIEEGVLKAEYIYNSQGQRTRKTVFDADGNSLGTTVYHYSRGALIEETDVLGQVVKSYVWNGMTLTAQIDHGLGGERLTYLYADHLYTARLGVDEGQAVVWRWEGEAFGSELAEELAGVVVNMRFPGQYFDGESGLHYNWNRYYDSSLGRYITSDPIGLAGGINTYGYVGGNTLGFIDHDGKKPRNKKRRNPISKTENKWPTIALPSDCMIGWSYIRVYSCLRTRTNICGGEKEEYWRTITVNTNTTQKPYGTCILISSHTLQFAMQCPISRPFYRDDEPPQIYPQKN